jgi:hypothetical protein
MARFTLCKRCQTKIGWVECPTGSWWAHEVHPADGHDAEPPDDDEFLLSYFTIAAALGRALDHDSPEFWNVICELQVDYPDFDWHNAMTDG